MSAAPYSAFFQYYNAEASLFEQRREHLRATLAVQRVDAQLAGAAAPSFAPPEDPGVPPELVEEAVAAERELFELLERTHAEARDRALESIQLLEDEIRTVDARREELAGLVDILAEEAHSSADLFKRGLRTQAINVASQRNLSLARVDLLEMERAFTLAQQRVAAERRDLNELELTRELDLRKERVARSDAAAAAEARIASLRQIALFPVLPQGQTAVAAAPGLRFVVERREDDGVERIEADEQLELEPGDLLVVSADLDAG